MIGVIAGDVIGSVHEHAMRKSTDFPLFDPLCRFTDDTVLTVATAYAILTGTSYEAAYRDFGRQHPHAGYGGSFYGWLMAEEPRPYNSWGNGSAMRVAPVGFAFSNMDDVLREAERSAEVTHNHVEGIKGAQATALAVFMARSGASKDEIQESSCGVSATTCTELWNRFGPTIAGTCLANSQSRKRSLLSWIRPMSRTPSDSPCRSAVMPTRRPQSLEASRRRFTDVCRRPWLAPYRAVASKVHRSH